MTRGERRREMRGGRVVSRGERGERVVTRGERRREGREGRSEEKGEVRGGGEVREK